MRAIELVTTYRHGLLNGIKSIAAFYMKLPAAIFQNGYCRRLSLV
jgi:hypothetical protein